MEKKNIKVIMGLIIAVIITIIALVVIFGKGTLEKNNQGSGTSTEKGGGEIKNIVGRITSIKSSKIEVTSLDGKNLVLKISPQAGASFVKQTLQPDGTILNEDVGLFDLPKNQYLRIQYYTQSNYIRIVEF